MRAGTEFRLLGPVEVEAADRLVDVGHARQRGVLAVLLTEANRVVSIDQLVERVWGADRVPANPGGAVRSYVSLLRRALTGVRGAEVVRQTPGYKAVVDTERVDLHRFHGLLRSARSATGDEQAAELMQTALALWRGEPFAGLDTPWINAVRQSLLVRRQEARLDLTEVQLRRGMHAALLADLTDQSDEHPLDERVTGHLMLALYRCGRQADALALFRRIRRRLAGELGTDPGPQLEELHQRILNNDPALAASTGRAAAGLLRPATSPAQLPAAPRLFTGRSRELEQLSTLLANGAESRDGPSAGTGVAIAAVSGLGGIGKSWLALHWAHRNAGRFPDGQLYVNLRGFDPSADPTSPRTVVRGFLDALGVGPAALPPDPDAQVGLYRSLVAGKRMLIVLDNARDTGQVTPLLPGSPTCAVLVTSRHHLGGLVAAHGARRIELEVLAEPEARAVLVRHLGEERIAAEPPAAGALLAGCAGLPLALGVVAARADRHPRFSLAALAAELRDESRRLDALDAGDPDPQATLRKVLSWSTHALSAAAVAGFGLLSLAPGHDIGLPAAAALLGRNVAETAAILRELEDASLLQQHAPGRYHMHDLVRLYAADRAGHDRTPAERQAALERVLGFYSHTAYAADRVLTPQRSPVVLPPLPPGAEPLALTEESEAADWFNAEHDDLVAAQRTAAVHDLHPTVWLLAWSLADFHLRRGNRHDELAMWQTALDAADRLPDPVTRIRTYRRLGLAYCDLERHTEATEHLERALALAQVQQDPAEQAHSHQMLAWVLEQQGDDRRALMHCTRALELYRTLDLPMRQAQALNSVGWYAARLGDYDSARKHCQAALTLHRRHHNVDGEAATMDSLGYIEHLTGHHQHAVDRYLEALARYRTKGNTQGYAETLDRLGHPYAALGKRDQARAVWQETLEFYRLQQRKDDVDRVQRQLDGIDG